MKDGIITRFNTWAQAIVPSVFISVGELLLDVTTAPEGQLSLDDDREASISFGGGGQAANFCAWAASLGERARLITRVDSGESARRLLAEIEAGGVEVKAVAGSGPQELEEEWFDGAELLHLTACSLFTEPLAAAARRAMDAVRARGSMVSVDLSCAAGHREQGGARLAYDLARVRPELLFATEAEAAGLGVPLEGLAKVPVVKLGARGCRVFGRRVPAPVVSEVDGSGAGDAFAAAFCAAYLDGATPLEAAGRAVLVGARAVTKAGAGPWSHR